MFEEQQTSSVEEYTVVPTKDLWVAVVVIVHGRSGGRTLGLR